MQQLHGSGKTTVLVERIINKITNEGIDIDRLLIVTFTNAAASEMRQRILEALYSKIDENPENENLQRQIILLNKANISTIHAFCLEVIKNYFYEINVSSNFRIGDSQEIELLKQETLEEIFEELYEENDNKFINLVNMYGGYRDDENLKELILKIYNYSQSTPFPEKWIKENVEKFNINDSINKDLSKTVWGKILIEYFKEELSDCINELEIISKKLKREQELEKYYFVLMEDIQNLNMLLKENNTWNDIYTNLANIDFVTWPRQAKTDCDLKDNCKKIRDGIKDRVKSLTKRIFIYSSEEANKDIKNMYNTLKALEMVILKFNEKYQKNKKEKNIIDFNDIEHFALQILVKRNEQNEYVPTEIANLYKEKFVEIAIDEYQDSNLVQEYILTTISNNNNIFMVGDVKQSIYKFRQARPELFLEKYDKYDLADSDEIKCVNDTKIQLFQNFRSRKNVLDLTNIIFNNIMTKKLGDIDYNQNEYLNCSADYIKPEKDINIAGKVELDIIDLAEDEEETTDDEELIEKTEIEARFVASRIKKLLEDDYYVYDKKCGYRKVTYKDIVILLRTTSNIALVYEKELNKLEIPVFSDTSSSYFETEEIQIILSVLKIIDNPNNDIPLVTVLRSSIFGFTDNELIEIRLNSKDTSFYEALLATSECGEDLELKEKTKTFLNILEQWQEKQEYLGLDELIWYLYESTGFYDYVNSDSNGELKIANLKLLFEKAKDYEKASFKGLYNFINYIDKISKGTGDASSAKLIGENENVVRIMSIHKSKGLEFPVVLLCGTGKQFNLQDLNQGILLHQDIGFGPKVVDYERKIEYNTIAKEAIRVKLLNETISEEMRLLYVALTRAKEKLIITGYDKNLTKSIKDIGNVVDRDKISTANIRKAKTYLKWLEIVCLKNEEELKDILEANFYSKNKIKSENLEKKEENTYKFKEWLKQAAKNEYKKIDNLLNWKYQYEETTKIEGKAAVTTVAKGIKRDLKELDTKPKFLYESEKISKSEAGTIMHLMMQKLDFRRTYTKEELKELIQQLIKSNIITEKQAEVINVNNILKFTNSKIYKELQKAKHVFTEKPFYIYLSADEIYKNNITDKILIQGIIDLYYIDENDKVILVDYKTDYVPNNDEQELISKYKRQLNIYKRALEQSLNRKVDSTYIYSLYLGKEVEIV